MTYLQITNLMITPLALKQLAYISQISIKKANNGVHTSGTAYEL